MNKYPYQVYCSYCGCFRSDCQAFHLFPQLWHTKPLVLFLSLTIYLSIKVISIFLSWIKSQLYLD
jgi:hypothetical protein